MLFERPNLRFVYVWNKKSKFFVNYGKWSRCSRNAHYGALKTVKMLWFPALCQWTLPGLCIWALPGGSQLSVHPSCIGSPLLLVEDHCLNNFLEKSLSYSPKYALIQSDCIIFDHQNLFFYQQNFFAESVFLDLDSWSRFFVWRVTHQIKLLEVLILVECGHACPAKPKLGKTRQRSFSVIWGVQAGWYCSKQKFS